MKKQFWLIGLILTVTVFAFAQTDQNSAKTIVMNSNWVRSAPEIQAAISNLLHSQHEFIFGLREELEPVITKTSSNFELNIDWRGHLEDLRWAHISSGLHVENFELKIINIEPSEMGNEEIVLFATEHISFDYIDTDSNTTIPSESYTKHKFTLSKTGKDWYVTQDELLNYLPIEKPEKFSDFQPPEGKEDFGKPITEEIINKKIKRQEGNLRKSSTFNHYAAKNYALQYALNYNPSYRSFSSSDCTNFASQSMRAGNWIDDLGWYRGQTN